jgi:hypothetical protein
LDTKNKFGIMPAEYAGVFGQPRVKEYLLTFVEVQKKALNGDYAYFRRKMEAGELPPMPLSWLTKFPVFARHMFHGWVTQSYKAQKALEAALFNDTANEEASMMSEVEGPPQEALAEMCVYPLAATRKHLQTINKLVTLIEAF